MTGAAAIPPTLAWMPERITALAELDLIVGPNTRSNEARVILGAVRSAKSAAFASVRTAVLELRRGRPPQRATPDTPHTISSVLLKPVSDACNLRCTYCYEGEDDERVSRPRMSEEVLESIIRDFLAQARTPVRFAWHGGEPLLAGQSLFEAGIAFQRRHNVHDVRVVNAVQTNGVLLTQRWVDFFLGHDFEVGMSVDGPCDVHDAARVGPGGRGSFQAVVAAIELLQRNHVPFGTITVVDDRLAGRGAELFTLLTGLGVTAFDVHPNYGFSTGARRPAVHPMVFSDFVIELFEAYLASGRVDVRIGVFADTFAALNGHEPATCYHAGNCCSIAGFEADGTCVPCTRPFDRTRYTFGNIRDGLPAILAGDTFRSFQAADLAGQATAKDCPWYSMCHNGCPQQRRDANGFQDVAGANYYCSCVSGVPGGYSAIFGHIAARAGAIAEALCEASAVAATPEAHR